MLILDPDNPMSVAPETDDTDPQPQVSSPLNPEHYRKSKIEAWDYIEDNIGLEGAAYFFEGNVKKYLHRWRYKNGLEDLEKGQVYLDRLIQTLRKMGEEMDREADYDRTGQ